jgi:hybrid cluster-associated redox disulfide protein
MKITKDTKIGEVLEKYPETIEVFAKFEMHCIGCPARGMETIEAGCKGHNFDEKKIDSLVKELNEKIKKKE